MIKTSLIIPDYSHVDVQVLNEQNYEDGDSFDIPLTKFYSILVKLLVCLNRQLEKVYENPNFLNLKRILLDTQKKLKYIFMFI